MPETRPCYIVDIDGTCADLTHRLWFIQGEKKDWDGFFGAVSEDKPIEHMQKVVCALEDYADIVFVTGRPERTRTDTVAWLDLHLFNNTGMMKIYMRQDGDYRPDHQVKSELLSAIILDGFEPIMAFDDRDQVVEMWRANEIPCAQVARGDF